MTVLALLVALAALAMAALALLAARTSPAPDPPATQDDPELVTVDVRILDPDHAPMSDWITALAMKRAGTITLHEPVNVTPRHAGTVTAIGVRFGPVEMICDTSPCRFTGGPGETYTVSSLSVHVAAEEGTVVR